MRWLSEREWYENIQLRLGVVMTLVGGGVGPLNSALSKSGRSRDDTSLPKTLVVAP